MSYSWDVLPGHLNSEVFTAQEEQPQSCIWLAPTLSIQIPGASSEPPRHCAWCLRASPGPSLQHCLHQSPAWPHETKGHHSHTELPKSCRATQPLTLLLACCKPELFVQNKPGGRAGCGRALLSPDMLLFLHELSLP